jgi:hypothetical protein
MYEKFNSACINEGAVVLKNLLPSQDKKLYEYTI